MLQAGSHKHAHKSGWASWLQERNRIKAARVSGPHPQAQYTAVQPHTGLAVAWTSDEAHRQPGLELSGVLRLVAVGGAVVLHGPHICLQPAVPPAALAPAGHPGVASLHGAVLRGEGYVTCMVGAV